MVMYYIDLEIKDPLIAEVLPIIICITLILLPLLVYGSRNNNVIYYITFALSALLSITQFIAVYKNIHKYPL